MDGGISVLLQPYFSAVPGNRAAGCCVFQNPFGGGRVSFVLFPVYPVSCLEGCGICILGAACGYAVQEQNGWHLHFLWRADVYLYPGDQWNFRWYQRTGFDVKTLQAGRPVDVAA